MNFGFASVLNIFKRWKFLVAFLVNQTGSVLYGYLLGIYPEQFSCLAANAMTVIVTLLAERFLKKQIIKLKDIVGIMLILIGIYLII